MRFGLVLLVGCWSCRPVPVGWMSAFKQSSKRSAESAGSYVWRPISNGYATGENDPFFSVIPRPICPPHHFHVSKKNHLDQSWSNLDTTSGDAPQSARCTGVPACRSTCVPRTAAIQAGASERTRCTPNPRERLRYLFMPADAPDRRPFSTDPWSRGYRSGWSKGSRGRAGTGRCAGPHRHPAGAWQNCAAAYAG